MKNLKPLFLMLAYLALSTPDFSIAQSTEIQTELIKTTANFPYSRVYILVNFPEKDGAIALPMADSLNKAFTEKNKIVRSEYQYEDEIALKLGPNMKNADAFQADGVLICQILQRVINTGAGSYFNNVKYRCNMLDVKSNVVVWTVKNNVTLNTGTIKDLMSKIATQITLDLFNKKIF